MCWALPILACIVATSPVYTGAHGDSPRVRTPLGEMVGTVIQSRLGKSIYSFRSIRYAQPPVGELRFQATVPVEPHEGIYNATVDPPFCPQPTTFAISEDCLFLNVYTTKLPESGNTNVKRPVIVHIHPGGFYGAGSASYLAGPEYFMDQDIVLVTFNYRLGSLGFLATDRREVSVNNGLKDQVEVLKWVKQNIEAFGGDSNSVTIHGYSAGSISVILHMISPMSVGLFHKAIAMSGSPTSQWPMWYHQLDVAKKQAEFVGCPSESAAEIFQCLKKKPAKELGDSLSRFAEFGTDPVLIWKPIVEKDYGQPRFLPEHPITLILKGQFQKVPLITGVTTDEFAYRSLFIANNKTLLKWLNEKWEEIAPIPFLYERGTNFSKEVSRDLRKFYFGDKPIDNSTLDKLGELYADSMVGFGVNRAAKLISERNNATYYYKFSFQGKYSHFYLPGTNNTVPYGVVHHDDLIYLFYISNLFPYFDKDSPREQGMVDKLTRLHTNFAKYGNPIPEPDDKLDNVEWETFNTNTQKYLDIGEKLTMREKLFEKRYFEWEKLFPLKRYKNSLWNY